MDADSGQGQLFRSYLARRTAAYAMALGSVAAFTIGAWQSSVPVMLRTLEVESSEFGERYELRIATDQDEIMLRRLLSPTLVSCLAHHPLAPGFELKAGTVCAAVPQALQDAGNLTFLIDATVHLAGRVLGQVREEQARVA